MQQDSCTYEITVLVTTHTRSVQEHTRQNPAWKWGSSHSIQSIAEKFSAIEGCWAREDHFFFKDAAER